MLDLMRQLSSTVMLLLEIGVAVTASAHAVLYKRDTRATIAWVGIIWLAPLVGTLFYVWLGINRIERRARSLRRRRPQPDQSPHRWQCSPDEVEQKLGSEYEHLKPLVGMVDRLTQQPLLPGNLVEPFLNGDQAYPAMLEAIDSATRSITLSTYIFDNDRAGAMFVDGLQRAAGRGVAVRVLIDDVGARYSWPFIPSLLRSAGIPCALFLPTWSPWRLRFSNLRTHRKLLVVDGCIGFTGGMNIREGHCLTWQPRHPTQDMHFRVSGPLVKQLQDVFVDDWAFSTSEILQGDLWFSDLHSEGQTLARGLADGPDESFELFRLTILGAIASAQTSILVVTPYFLPDSTLITALNIAAMRGISVQIVLPQQNNLAFVKWASTALLWQLLERGCQVWHSPPPFDHSKIFVVDGAVSFVGTSNWDPRSLRLNFEFNLECYDTELATNLTQVIRSKMEQGHRVTLADVDSRSLPTKLRDGIARLFSPYL